MRSAEHEGKARKRRAPATTKMAGDCEGVSRVPGSKDQSGSFRASATSANQLARVMEVYATTLLMAIRLMVQCGRTQ